MAPPTSGRSSWPRPQPNLLDHLRTSPKPVAPPPNHPRILAEGTRERRPCLLLTVWLQAPPFPGPAAASEPEAFLAPPFPSRSPALACSQPGRSESGSRRRVVLSAPRSRPSPRSPDTAGHCAHDPGRSALQAPERGWGCGGVLGGVGVAGPTVPGGPGPLGRPLPCGAAQNRGSSGRGVEQRPETGRGRDSEGSLRIGGLMGCGAAPEPGSSSGWHGRAPGWRNRPWLCPKRI